ncbi:MAG: potassium channel family protein [Bacteroidales bacterium]
MKTQLIKLEIAPIKEVKRDLLRNCKFIILTLLVLLLYIFISSLIVRCYEYNWTFLHCIYSTIIQITTVGFGAAEPITHGGKIIACINAFIGIVFFGIVVASITIALQPNPSSYSGSINQSIEDNDDVPEKIANGIEALSKLFSRALLNDTEEIIFNGIHIRIHKEISESKDVISHIGIFVDIDNNRKTSKA